MPMASLCGPNTCSVTRSMRASTRRRKRRDPIDGRIFWRGRPSHLDRILRLHRLCRKVKLQGMLRRMLRLAVLNFCVRRQCKGHTRFELWKPIRPSLGNIEQLMSLRIEKKQSSAVRQHTKDGTHLVKVEEGKLSEDSDDEFYDVDKVDPSQELHSGDSANADIGSRSHEENYPSEEELECLVHGGLPMALRGELWQAFVGIGTHRVNGYYGSLLAAEGELEDSKCLYSSTSERR